MHDVSGMVKQIMPVLSHKMPGLKDVMHALRFLLSLDPDSVLIILPQYSFPQFEVLVKTIAILMLAATALFSSGCSLGIPISPLMFLLKNDAPTINQTVPGSAAMPAVTPTQADDAQSNFDAWA